MTGRQKQSLSSKTFVVQPMDINRYPTLYILTRTSGRPNYFKKCRQSITNQSYINIKHIIGIDEDTEYIQNMKDIDPARSYAEPIIVRYEKGDKTKHGFPWNLYMNELQKWAIDDAKETGNFDTAYILYLDDDDCLTQTTSISTMVNKLNTKPYTDILHNPKNSILLWPVRFPGTTIPRKALIGKPVEADIASCGILFPLSMTEKIIWDGEKCGDYRAIMQIWALAKKKLWINGVLTGIQRDEGWGGFGERDDCRET